MILLSPRSVVLLASLLTAADLAAQATWSTRPTGPLGRHFFGAAYDSARSKLVVFGGQAASQAILGDTWEWDGATWSQVATTGPAARCFHAMGFDSARGRVVVHAGLDGNNQILGDTWEWDGATWTQRSPATSPGARNRHAGAYDPVRQRFVIFGGLAQGLVNLADTWEWDGTNWTQVQSPARPPVARNLHAMAFHARLGRIVMFGGETTAATPTYRDDTWSFDGTQWQPHTTATRPSARTMHAMSYDRNRGRIVLFGGQSLAIYGDTWEFDGTSWVSRTIASAPSPRHGHVLGFDAARGQTVLYGGYTGIDETWVYACPCDTFAPAVPTGGITMTCTGSPILGTQFCLVPTFGNSPSALMLGAMRLTPLVVPAPFACVTSNVHLDPLLTLAIPSNNICFQVPNDPGLYGGSFLVQAVGVGAGPNCFAFSDAVSLTVQ